MVRGRIAYLWASDYFTSDRAIKAKVQHHADLYAKAKKMKKDGAPVINMAGASLNVPPEHAMKRPSVHQPCGSKDTVSVLTPWRRETGNTYLTN